MNKVVLTPELQAALGDVTKSFYIYDKSGRPVLYVAPAGRSAYECEEPTLTEEEIAERMAEGGRSLQEFLAELTAEHP